MIQVKPRSPVFRQTHPLARGLIGAWLMHEGGGSTVRALDPLAPDGTVTNSASWTISEQGATIQITGTDGYVNFGDYDAFDNAKTIIMRVRRDGSGATFERLIDKGTNEVQEIYLRSGVDWRVTYRVNGVDKAGNVAGTELNTGAWYDIAVVNEFAGGSIYLYMNGVLRATGTGTTPTGGNSNLTIGGGNITRWFNGRISHVYLYNRALTSEEVRSVHVSPYQAFEQRPFLALTAGGVALSTVQLSWTDNSDDEDGFSIERSTTSATAGFAEIDTVAADTTTYDDTDLAAGTYWYRVRAFRGSTYSEYSNVEEITVT